MLKKVCILTKSRAAVLDSRLNLYIGIICNSSGISLFGQKWFPLWRKQMRLMLWSSSWVKANFNPD
jgi:hypothetical protein